MPLLPYPIAAKLLLLRNSGIALYSGIFSSWHYMPLYRATYCIHFYVSPWLDVYGVHVFPLRYYSSTPEWFGACPVATGLVLAISSCENSNNNNISARRSAETIRVHDIRWYVHPFIWATNRYARHPLHGKLRPSAHPSLFVHPSRPSQYNIPGIQGEVELEAARDGCLHAIRFPLLPDRVRFIC